MLSALVAIVLGNFLIGVLFVPAFNRLREVLNKFASIQLPFESVWDLLGQNRPTEEERRKAADAAMAGFGLYFREYCIAFEPFKRIGYIFLTALVVLATVTVWQTEIGIEYRLMLTGTSVLAISFGAIYVQRLLAPSPHQLISVDFLANNFANLHLEPFFDAAEPQVGFGVTLDQNDDKLHFTLLADAIIWDYRLLFAVTDASCRTLHVAVYGNLDSKAKFEHTWNAERSSFAIRLSDFDFAAALAVSDHLFMHLWLFIPTPRGWFKDRPDNPRFLTEGINSPGQGVRLGSSPCKWDNVDRNVGFESKSLLGFWPSWKLLNVQVPSENCPQRIVKALGRELAKTKGLRCKVYSGGKRIQDLG